MSKQFARYDSYKDSGVEWLGQIPAHWEVKKLNSILTVKSEKNCPDLPLLSVYREYGVILKDSRDDNHNAAALDLSGYKVVKNGDFVINKMKAWQGSMGISQYHGIVSPAYITCNVDYNIMNARYLHALLRCSSYIGEYNRLSYGVRIGQWDMHFEDFKNIHLCIIPINEQQRIADFLDKKTAQIDEAIAQKEKMIELLKEYRQVVINNAVTKGLDPNVPMKDSGIEWLGQIPAHWQVLPGMRLIIENKILNKGMKESQVLSLSYGKIIIKPLEKLVGLVPDSFETYQLVKPNDIIIRCTDLQNDQTSLRTGIAMNNGIITSAYLNFSVKAEYSAKFIHYYLRALDTSKVLYKLGSGLRQNLSYLDFKRLEFTFPLIEEQQNIVNFLDKKSAQINEAISLKQSEIEKLKEYKATLIDSAVTGKIKV